MNITDYFPEYKEVGYAKKSYGVNGHIRIFIEKGYEVTFDQAKHCFFLLKGCLVPYFIKDYENGVVKFDSCSNPEDTKVIASKSIYLHQDQILPMEVEEDSEGFSLVEGYMLVNDETEEEIGLIRKIEVYPEQEIAVVEGKQQEYLIPLNFHNVKGIDQESRRIFVEIPQGLLEINT